MAEGIQIGIQSGMSSSKFSKKLTHFDLCMAFAGRVISDTCFCHKPRSRRLGKVASIFIPMFNETINELEGFHRAKPCQRSHSRAPKVNAEGALTGFHNPGNLRLLTL